MSRLQKLLGVGKGYLERLPPVDVHKLLRIVLMNLPYIVIFYVGNKLAWLYQYCVGDSMIERLMVLVLNFQMAFSRILPSMHKNELLVGITGAVAVKLLVYMKGKNAKKFRQGVEYGSARWGTAKDIRPLELFHLQPCLTGNGGRLETTIFVDCLHWHFRDSL